MQNKHDTFTKNAEIKKHEKKMFTAKNYRTQKKLFKKIKIILHKYGTQK